MKHSLLDLSLFLRLSLSLSLYLSVIRRFKKFIKQGRDPYDPLSKKILFRCYLKGSNWHIRSHMHRHLNRN